MYVLHVLYIITTLLSLYKSTSICLYKSTIIQNVPVKNIILISWNTDTSMLKTWQLYAWTSICLRIAQYDARFTLTTFQIICAVMSICVKIAISKQHGIRITYYSCHLTRWVSLVEQELSTLPEYPSSFPVFVWFLLLNI